MRALWMPVLLCAVISWAQPPEPPPAPPVLGVGNGPMAGPPVVGPPPGAMEMPPGMMGGVPLTFEQMRDMLVGQGMDEKDATFMALLASGGDSSWLLPYLMMSERGGGMEDIMGMLVMSKMLAPQGTAGLGWISGKYIFIVENGVLYKINTDTMQVEGRVAYRGGGPSAEVMAALGPMLERARAKAQQTSCLSNLKQLGLAFLMYAQDWDEKLPGKDWVAATQPYLKNMQVLICPSRPDVKVGYVYNEAVMGASLKRIGNPANTILLFEGEPVPGKDFGGPERIAEGGYHNHGVNVLFVDGHVKWLPVAEAKELLAAPKP
jgi:prepilin-type processing-associated H-X9-DG protein